MIGLFLIFFIHRVHLDYTLLSDNSMKPLNMNTFSEHIVCDIGTIYMDSI